MRCDLCPRNCLNACFCGKADTIKIAKVMRHFWEEPIISGAKGSGAVFFSNCSLKCCFCQNYQISHLGQGTEFDIKGLINIFKILETSDVENINLVSPTHYADKILTALKIYKPKVPIVWNTSGYEKPENIKKLKGFVDIFLFDFKYFDNDLGFKYSKVLDYFENCFASLKMAREILPKDILEDGIMKRGIIIRHLVLPSHIDDSIKIFDFLSKNFSKDIYISLMSQYAPFFKAKDFAEINRKLTTLEYKKVVSHIKKLGFEKGFMQDIKSSSCQYTPDFSYEKFWEL